MTTIVGIKTNEGVVLGSDRRASKGFFIGSKITQKIAKIDDFLAVAIAGQLSDAEYMIKVAKAERRLMESTSRISAYCKRICEANCKPGIFWS